MVLNLALGGGPVDIYIPISGLVSAMWGDFAARGAVLKSFRQSDSSDIREQDWTGTILMQCSTDVALTTTGTDVALTGVLQIPMLHWQQCYRY